ncbi:uncharacterized protein LOC118746121 [Rhagoletis pomonella]|uniref:uncharacterized protein LOC118746121 n=1 Tax=Rhagoletis pomonella TaxID=28610 RepID=UPI001782CFA6|nr:uncharacterized protein LOC118746121 [Rhagoletis pomonella]
MANPPSDRPRHIKCLQVNLHHAKAASDVLCRRFKTELLDVAFIQEPWVFAGAIKGLNDCDELTQQDLAAVWTKVPTQMGEQEVVLASAYLPGDSCEMPTREVIALEEYCRRRKLKLVITVTPMPITVFGVARTPILEVSHFLNLSLRTIYLFLTGVMSRPLSML